MTKHCSRCKFPFEDLIDIKVKGNEYYYCKECYFKLSQCSQCGLGMEDEYLHYIEHQSRTWLLVQLIICDNCLDAYLSNKPYLKEYTQFELN